MADQKSGISESAVGWGILACVFGAIGYLVWWHFHEQIRSMIRWVRYGEMWIMSFFVSPTYTVEWQGQPVSYDQMMTLARDIPSEKINAEFLSVLSTVAMAPYLFPLIFITLCFGMWVLFRGPGTEHRTKFDIDSLIKKQSNIFPIIAPL
jgi:hypothetical protein